MPMIEAVYENGVFRPEWPVDLTEGERVHLMYANGQPVAIAKAAVRSVPKDPQALLDWLDECQNVESGEDLDMEDLERSLWENRHFTPWPGRGNGEKEK